MAADKGAASTAIHAGERSALRSAALWRPASRAQNPGP